MTVSSFKTSTDFNPFDMHARLLRTPTDDIDWLIQRRRGIAASDTAAILGMDKYSTAYSVWLDKTGQVPLRTSLDSEAAGWGHLLEPVIRDEAAKRLGYPVTTIGGLQSRTHEFQTASLDAVLDVPGDGMIPLECKNTSQYLQADWADDQVPDRAELQVQHQLAVTGAPYAYVAGLIGGNRLVTRRVDRDQELIDVITAEEEAFMQHVLDGTPPPITARDSIATILGAAGQTDDDVLVLDREQAHVARRWLDALAAASLDEKEALAKKSEAKNNLAAIAGNHKLVVEELHDADGHPDITVDLFRMQRGVFAARKFQTEEPDLSALFMKKVEVVDTAALKNEDPALYRRFQSVSVRAAK